GVRERGRPAAGAQAPLLREAAEGARLVVSTPLLRGLLAWALLDSAIVIAPEGLAVAVAAGSGDGALAAGVLTAAIPAGFLVGSFLLVKVPCERRKALFLPLLLISALPLLATPFLDRTGLIVACWALAGTGTALQLVANAAFVQAVPRHLRGRAYGVAGTALAAVQGVVLLLAGALAELTGPEVAIALIALVGLALAPLAQWAGRTKVQGIAPSCRVAS
ncbi:MAG: major facilitator superfamily 1, partial [Frankiales bacterium]|nr:major facilitator superfamily 1 [Frankiales bacterium]